MKHGIYVEDYLISEWTINLKSFETLVELLTLDKDLKWTINLKSFEILLLLLLLPIASVMNYKLEKFWNIVGTIKPLSVIKWTINLKSFEIKVANPLLQVPDRWTINLKSFEITKKRFYSKIIFIMNYKLEKFWNLLPASIVISPLPYEL